MENERSVPAVLLSAYALFLFLLGGSIYAVIEVLWRGHTHFTMPILGGLCFLVLAYWYYARFPLWLRGLLGVCSILILEYVAGLLLNRVLGLAIWDYSNLPYSLHGQICLQYGIYWFYLTVAAFLVLPTTERICFFPLWIRRRRK